MRIFTSFMIRLIKIYTISILWGCAIAVLNRGMSQVLVQFVDQYIQLAGSGATVKKKRMWLCLTWQLEKASWLINLLGKSLINYFVSLSNMKWIWWNQLFIVQETIKHQVKSYSTSTSQLLLSNNVVDTHLPWNMGRKYHVSSSIMFQLSRKWWMKSDKTAPFQRLLQMQQSNAASNLICRTQPNAKALSIP